MLDKFRKPIMAVVDLLLINLSLYLAFMIRFDWRLTPAIIESCVFFMIWASAIRIILFAVLGLYQWSFRYASISEAMNVVKAVTIGSLLLVAVAFFTKSTEIGRSVLLIDYLICLFAIGVSRFLLRVLIKFRQFPRFNLKRVLIVGAGAAGAMVVRELINVKNRVYQPIGFIDDDRIKMHSRIHGIRVLGTTNDIKDVVRKHNIDAIIIAIPSVNGKTIRSIVSKCEKTGTKIKIVPELHKILTGEIAIRKIRNVQPEDLLGRKTVEIDTKNVNSFIKDKVVLITGAAGSIGSELCRQVMRFNPELLILYDYNENEMYFLELELKKTYPYLKFKTVIGDIKDTDLANHIFSKYKPQIVFHSAAHKHVSLMEENSVAAVKNNIIGTKNLMGAAEHYGIESFVVVSTDKAVKSTSVMGASKRIAEMMVQAKTKTNKTKFMAVRFGNVMGSSGSVVPILKQQIENGGPVTITRPEVKRFFMTGSEAVQLIIQAGVIGKGGEIFILDMGEQIKIVDLARNLITLSGFEPDEDIEIEFIGLRLGEKMYAEPLLDLERDKATIHNKIYIAQPNNFNPFQLGKDIETLEQLTVLMDEDRIIEKMKEMVPDYNPNGNGK